MAKKPSKKSAARRDAKTFTPQTDWLKNRLRDRGVSLDAAAEALGTYKLMLHRILGGGEVIESRQLIFAAPIAWIRAL